MLIKKIKIEVIVVYITFGKNLNNQIEKTFSFSEIKNLKVNTKKEYIKKNKKFKIIMLIKHILMYFLIKVAVKLQKIRRTKEEKEKTTGEKQSKKKPQITPKIIASSFFKNKAEQIAKEKTKAGFALKNKTKISVDCKTVKKNAVKIKINHFLKLANLLLVLIINSPKNTFLFLIDYKLKKIRKN